MNNTFWTEEEVIILKNNYRKIPSNKLTELLPNRTRRAILEKAKYMGFSNKNLGLTTDRVGKIKELNQKGISDRGIAKLIGIKPTSCYRYRKMMDLESNHIDSRVLEAEKMSQEEGFPIVKSQTEVWILKFLREGPRTSKQLIVDLGLKKSSLTWIVKCLRTLKNKDLIVVDNHFVYHLKDFREDNKKEEEVNKEDWENELKEMLSGRC